MSQLRAIDRWNGGVGWIADPDETMQRASHAIQGETGYWLVDPVDADGLEELLDEFEIAGIVVTLDRHKRDARFLAERYDVPIAVPAPLAGEAEALGNAVTDDTGFRDDTGWDVVPVIERRWWHEVALYSEKDDVVYVSESLGTASYFCGPGEELGVHPVVRIAPPRSVLQNIRADRVLVGHGEGIATNGVALMTAALRDARRNAPRTYWKALRQLI